MIEGKKLGRFRIGEQIKPGGEGAVWRAEEEVGPGSTRPAAVKVLKGLLQSNEQIEKRLRREAEALVALSSSPNIVEIRHFDFQDGQAWLAMEYVERSLSDLIGDGPGDPKLVAGMIRDVTQGLHAIHTNQPPFLHRDIKPANILVTARGVHKIADFGLAGAELADVTMRTATVRYCAPEMLSSDGRGETAASDLYSLGLVAYEYALGKKLFRQQFGWVKDDQALETGPAEIYKWKCWHTDVNIAAPPLADLVPGFPEGLSDLIARLMAKDPVERFTTAEAVLHALSDLPREELGTQILKMPPPPPAAPAKRGPGARAPAARAPAHERAAGAVATGTAKDSATAGTIQRQKKLVLWGAIASLAVLLAMIPLLSRSGPLPVILMQAGVRSADGSSLAYETREPTLTIQGRIENLPEGAAIIFATRDGARATLMPGTDGTFTHRIRMGQVGSVVGGVAVQHPDGEILTSESFTLIRHTPERVQVALQVRPATAGIRLAFTDPASSATIVEVTTDAAGQVRAPIPYGVFQVRSLDDDYVIDDGGSGASGASGAGGAGRFETGIDLETGLEVNLIQKYVRVEFDGITPASAAVTLTRAGSEPVTVALDERGNAVERLEPGRWQVAIAADGFAPWQEEIDFRRQPDAHVVRALLSTPQAGADGAQAPLAMRLPDAPDYDAIQLAGLSDDRFREWAAAVASPKGLSLGWDAALHKVRVTGWVLNERELAALRARLEPAAGRADAGEVVVDPDMVRQLVSRDLRDAGGKAVKAQVRGGAADAWLLVELTTTEALPADRARDLATAYVYDSALIRINAYR